jgi:hypothetical protein
MRAELGLPSVRGDDDQGGGMTGGFGGSMGGALAPGKGAKRPIQVKFEIPYFTTSGIQVRYLKITEPKVRRLLQTLHDDLSMLTSAPVTIPLAALGAVYYTVWRYCCEAPRCCQIRKRHDSGMHEKHNAGHALRVSQRYLEGRRGEEPVKFTCIGHELR